MSNWAADMWAASLAITDTPSFTSLGSTHNTAPNPLLKTEAGYEPAWKLQDPSQERAGRGVKAT